MIRPQSELHPAPLGRFAFPPTRDIIGFVIHFALVPWYAVWSISPQGETLIFGGIGNAEGVAET